MTSVQFATNEGSPAATATSGPFSGKYNNGPFAGVIAYQYNNNIRGVTNFELDDSAFSVAAQWQFSRFNIAGKYEWLDYDFTASNQPQAPVLGNALRRS